MPYNSLGQWTGNTTVENQLSEEDAVTTGLGGALQLIANQSGINYPGYVPTETTGPSQLSYIGYSSNTPLSSVITPSYQLNMSVNTPQWQNTGLNSSVPTAQTAGYNWSNYGRNAPQYQGLMGGDYNRLEQALNIPGAIAATNAYNTGSQALNSAMSGRGLYGSSIMGNQMNQGLNREYMNAMATNAGNAAAQRYGMQQTDLANASGQALEGWKGLLGESTAANQAGLDYSKLATNTNLANAANQLTSTQNLNQLGMQQGLAQNAQNMDIYGKQMAQSEAANQYGLSAAAQQMQQNQALYNSSAADAQRQQAYNLAAMEYENAGTEATRDWQNEQAYNQYKYDVAAGNYANVQNQQLINEYLALAGKGQLGSTSSSSGINDYIKALLTIPGLLSE